jgi:hypothetical protein
MSEFKLTGHRDIWIRLPLILAFILIFQCIELLGDYTNSVPIKLAISFLFLLAIIEFTDRAFGRADNFKLEAELGWLEKRFPKIWIPVTIILFGVAAYWIFELFVLPENNPKRLETTLPALLLALSVSTIYQQLKFPSERKSI